MVIILGKNGAGKSYLLGRLAKKGYCSVVNYTTRQKRPTEIEGLDYYFVSLEKFEELVSESFFIEYKKLGQNYYGTPKNAINNKSVMVSGNITELQKKIYEEVIPIFVNASIEKRFHRVLNRKLSQEEIFKRFHGENFKYLNDFSGFFIDNEQDNETAINEILEYIGQEGKIISHNRLLSNKTILKENVEKFDSSALKLIKNPMLLFLKYDEYLMKLLSLQNFATVEELQSEYIIKMKNFMQENGLEFYEKDGNLFVKFQEMSQKIDFDKEKLSKELGLGE